MSRASGVHSLRVSAAGAIGLREPAGAWRHAGARLSARSATWAVLTLAAAFLISFALKAANIGVGAPQFMIDDFTLYQGGFLVWFGQAPPQHAFLESWVCGLSSLLRPEDLQSHVASRVFLIRPEHLGELAAAQGLAQVVPRNFRLEE